MPKSAGFYCRSGPSESPDQPTEARSFMAIVPFVPGMHLGVGYQPDKGEVAECALQPASVSQLATAGQDVNYKLAPVETTEELCRALKISASLSVADFGSSLSVEATMAQNSVIEAGELLLVLLVQVSRPAKIMNERELTYDALSFIDAARVEEFKRFYGTHYVSGIIEGGTLICAVKVACKDIAERSELSAKMRLSGHGAEGGAMVKQVLEENLVGKSTTLTLGCRGGKSLQVPGTIEALIDLVCRWPEIVSADPVEAYALTDAYDRTIPATQAVSIDPFVKQAICENIRHMSVQCLKYRDKRGVLEYYRSGAGLKEIDEAFPGVKGDSVRQMVLAEIDAIDEAVALMVNFMGRQHQSIHALPLPAGLHALTVDMPSLIAKEMRDREEKAMKDRLEALEKRVAQILDGTLVVGKAQHADSADSATSAETSKTAERATAADRATEAGRATEADHATGAGRAAEADHATKADHATDADHATKADHATDAGHATGADSATVLAGVNVSGPPFEIKVLRHLHGTINDWYDTGYSSSEWVVTVAGFCADRGDIDEHGVKVNPIVVWCEPVGGVWKLNVDLASEGTHERWNVVLLAMKAAYFAPLSW